MERASHGSFDALFAFPAATEDKQEQQAAKSEVLMYTSIAPVDRRATLGSSFGHAPIHGLTIGWTFGAGRTTIFQTSTIHPGTFAQKAVRELTRGMQWGGAVELLALMGRYNIQVDLTTRHFKPERARWRSWAPVRCDVDEWPQALEQFESLLAVRVPVSILSRHSATQVLSHVSWADAASLLQDFRESSLEVQRDMYGSALQRFGKHVGNQAWQVALVTISKTSQEGLTWDHHPQHVSEKLMLRPTWREAVSYFALLKREMQGKTSISNTSSFRSYGVDIAQDRYIRMLYSSLLDGLAADHKRERPRMWKVALALEETLLEQEGGSKDVRRGAWPALKKWHRVLAAQGFVSPLKRASHESPSQTFR